MNKLTLKLLSLLVIGLPLSAQAISIDKYENTDFVVKITSKHPQPIYGSIMVDHRLVMINAQTPYIRKFNASYVQLMVGTDQTNPLIKVDVFAENKEYSGKPNEVKLKPVSGGSGHYIYDCNSSRTARVNICNGYNYSG